MKMLVTARLELRQLGVEDAAFILRLVNDPSWLRFIGDRGIRTLEDARAYLLQGPMAMYARLGFGLWLVELKEGSVPVGICGLLKREALEDVEIGFAFLPAYWGKGYAFESAAAVLAYGETTLGLKRVVAIITPENEASGRLLEKLGFGFERLTRLSRDAAEVKLYVVAVG